MNIDRYMHDLRSHSEDIRMKFNNTLNVVHFQNPYLGIRSFTTQRDQIYRQAKDVLYTRTIFSNSLKADFLWIQNDFYSPYTVPLDVRIQTSLQFHKRSIVKFLSPIICTVAAKALTSYSNWFVATIGAASFIIAPKLLDYIYSLENIDEGANNLPLR